MFYNINISICLNHPNIQPHHDFCPFYHPTPDNSTEPSLLYACREQLERGAILLVGRRIEEHEEHFMERGLLVHEERCYGLYRDRGGLRDGIAIRARTDRWEGDAGEVVLGRQVETCLIGGGEQRSLVRAAAPPDRPDGVDDVPSGELAAGRDYGLAGG